MSKRKGWRECGCYVWRTRKPSAPWGLPFIGRHFGYVGETGSRFHRDPQHIEGGGTYSAVAKDWADLDPKCYPLPCPFPRWKWTRKAMETLYIAILCPVYNVQKQPPWNVRRISSRRAARQRYTRDLVGPKSAAWPRLAFNVGLFLTIWAAYYFLVVR
jgi:hypothetical protein